MEKRNVILVSFGIACLLIALTLVYITFAPGRSAGAGRTAELVHPTTGQRTTIPWSKVLKDGQFDPFTAKYRYKYPNTNDWAYAVDPGTPLDLEALNKMTHDHTP